MSEEEKRAWVAAIITSSWIQGPIDADQIYDALSAILVRGEIPTRDLLRWYVPDLAEPYRTQYREVLAG